MMEVFIDSESLRFFGKDVPDGDRVRIPLENPPRLVDVGAKDFTIVCVADNFYKSIRMPHSLGGTAAHKVKFTGFYFPLSGFCFLLR